MSWEKTLINLTLKNDAYSGGTAVKRFNNIIQEPSKEQIQLLSDAIVMLSDGDQLLSSQIVKHENV
ncbi:hypothetical protein [Companilactobacillus metriopterae]|uniref:hypothetical protein n=1 Tax=Companilactobacillus metriopterae TaxID=1909267 RepID=UPI00100B456A|nr:hypothetical protein [Companilactobacillus metriopterae]